MQMHQQTVSMPGFESLTFEMRLNVMRNVGVTECWPEGAAVRMRSSSLPAIMISPSHSVIETPAEEEEEEEQEQALAGRLEIRVVEGSGGATIVKTTVDKEPLQSMSFFYFNFALI